MFCVVGDGNCRRKEYSASLYVSIDGADKKDIQKEDMEEYYEHISPTTLFHLPFFFSVFSPKFIFCFCFLIENKKKKKMWQ